MWMMDMRVLVSRTTKDLNGLFLLFSFLFLFAIGI